MESLPAVGNWSGDAGANRLYSDSMNESSHTRVSEDERERALGELSRHFSGGRLTAPEFEERSTAVWAAGTRRELAQTFADLPAAPALVPGSEVGPIPGMVVRAGAVAIAAIVCWLVLGNVLWLLLFGVIPALLLLAKRRR